MYYVKCTTFLVHFFEWIFIKKLRKKKKHSWGASWDKANALIYFKISQCKFISVKTAKSYILV